MNSLFLQTFKYKFNSLETKKQREIVFELMQLECKTCNYKLFTHECCDECDKQHCATFRCKNGYVICINCAERLNRFSITNQNHYSIIDVDGYEKDIDVIFKKDYTNITYDKLIKLLKKTKNQNLLKQLEIS